MHFSFDLINFSGADSLHLINSNVFAGFATSPLRGSPQAGECVIRRLFYLDDLSVGGEEGVGEEGCGLVGEEFGFFVAGTDMGEQQLFGFREGGQAGGLAGGEVLALAGQLGEVVGEGALEAEERRVAHEGHQVFAVGGVAGVGVDTCGVAATRHLGDAKAIGGD